MKISRDFVRFRRCHWHVRRECYAFEHRFWEEHTTLMPKIINQDSPYGKITRYSQVDYHVLFQFHTSFSHVSVMLRDRSSHEAHTYPHVSLCGSHVSSCGSHWRHTTHTCVYTTPHVSQVWKNFLTCEQTCEIGTTHVDHMWTHVDHMWIQRDFFVREYMKTWW